MAIIRPRRGRAAWARLGHRPSTVGHNAGDTAMLGAAGFMLDTEKLQHDVKAIKTTFAFDNGGILRVQSP